MQNLLVSIRLKIYVDIHLDVHAIGYNFINNSILLSDDSISLVLVFANEFSDIY